MSGAGTDPAGSEAVPTPDWRQCCLCKPSDPAGLPSHLRHLPSNELLLIGTQTCSLAGQGVEPAFEVFVAKPMPEFVEDTDAARGRMTRFLELTVEGSTEIAGVSLDISRRAILPRDDLSRMNLLPL